jgi:RNA recognition motif-containing protein
MTRIYLGNLSQQTTEESLRTLLQREGRTVTFLQIKKNATSGKPRGFAFADLGSPEEAQAAIAELQGATVDGKTIKAGLAKEQVQRSAARDSGGWGSGGSGGGRGGRRY